MDIRLWLPFDDPDEATSFRELSGLMQTYTLVGAPKTDTDAGSGAPYATSLLLDGVDDSIQLANPYLFALGTRNFTIRFKYRPAGRLDGYPAVFGTYVTYGTNGGLAFFDRHASAVSKFSVAFNGTFPFLQSTTTVTNGTLYDIELTRSGSTWRLFINGALESTATSSAAVAVVLGSGQSIYIGRSPDSADSHIYGRLSDFQLIDGTAVHTAAFTPDLNHMQKMSGVILDAAGNPAQRTVRSYQRANGRLIAETLSDPVTGAYELPFPRGLEAQRVVLDDAAGSLLNDRIARVSPTP